MNEKEEEEQMERVNESEWTNDDWTKIKKQVNDETEKL